MTSTSGTGCCQTLSFVSTGRVTGACTQSISSGMGKSCTSPRGYACTKLLAPGFAGVMLLGALVHELIYLVR